MLADVRPLIAKYGARGYRFALLEVSHIAPNILLTCTALHLAAVPIGGFLDDECTAVFCADRSHLSLFYLVVIGRLREGNKTVSTL
jgi:nitroreductase